MRFVSKWVMGVCAVLAAMTLFGCARTSLNRAPVEDISSKSVAQKKVGKPVAAQEVKYYTAQPGDNLHRIGLKYGYRWQDIAAWNNLENAHVIEVGQVLRVSPPATAAVAAASGSVVSKPVGSSQVKPVTPAVVAAAPVKPNKPVDAAVPSFIWPANGALLNGFNEVTNKGFDIGGKAGDPILAAADGRVVYAGAGLRGYGNLIILKHNEQYLTAYAHNRILLVKEDQKVSKGQKIAEMGDTDSERVKLHFEVRRQGLPVNPSGYLPNR